MAGAGEGGEVGRGTVSCRTLVRSVRIRAIMKREGLPGVPPPPAGVVSVLRLKEITI